MVKRISILALFAVSCFGQSGPSRSPAKTPAKNPSSQSAPDTWQRQKECLDLARQYMQERDRELPPSDGDIREWRAHYSPKYGHCYVHVQVASLTVLNSRPILPAAETTQLGPDKWMQRRDWEKLTDVLEHTDVAYITHNGEGSNLTGAKIRDTSTTDEEAKAFIKDHMEH
jgi:hypothetical protein